MSDRCQRCGEVPNPDGQCACPKQQAASSPAGSARAYSDEQVEWLLGQIELMGNLKESDNRKLLWIGMNTKAWKSLDVGSVEAAEDRAELGKLMGLDAPAHSQGVSIAASSDYYREFIDRAEGRTPAKVAQPYWD